MEGLKILVWLLLIELGSSENSLSEPCSDGSTDIEEVHRWWFDEMSVKKPVRCKTPEDWKFKKDENYHLATRIVTTLKTSAPIRSYRCHQSAGELSIKYRFTGKIENGILTGPGKLVFDGPDISQSHEACLNVVGFQVSSKGNLLSLVY